MRLLSGSLVVVGILKTALVVHLSFQVVLCVVSVTLVLLDSC